MRQSLDDLLAIVYRFYPRGARQDDPGYKDTEEHRRLVQARMRAGTEGNLWDVLLERLSARLPKEKIQNGSVHLPGGSLDASYVGWLWLPPRGPEEKNHRISFLISFLAPCYVVYSSAHVAVSGSQPQDWSHEISFTFSRDEQPFAQIVMEEILSVFPGYEPMPPEVGNAIVPDVEAGNQLLGKSTLYHCLFTDYW